jgi:hypothetical protein
MWGGIMLIPGHPLTQSPHLCDHQSALPPHNFGNIASFTSLSFNQGQHSCVVVSSIFNFFDFKNVISLILLKVSYDLTPGLKK